MAKSDLGIPERPVSRARGGVKWIAVLALAALFFLLACGASIFLFSRGPTYALPTVAILEPQYGVEISSGKTVPVLSNARSAERIVKQELWVDGLVAYVASSNDPQGQADFTSALMWTPQVGLHTLVSRAVDGRGGVGTSNAVRVNVTASAAGTEEPNSLQIATPGDTLNSIAEENGISPDAVREANPDLQDQLKPGDIVNVPPGGQEGRNDDLPGGEVNNPGDGPLPDDLSAERANPNPDVLGFTAPFLFWDTILPWRDTSLRAPTAPKLKAAPGPDCSAVLTWVDTSNNEKGFYLYRLIPGAPRFARLEPGFRATNSNSTLTYSDRGVFGRIEYYVVAFNNAGEAASRTVAVDIVDQRCMGSTPQVLEVEASLLTVGLALNALPAEVYCYAALKGMRPFERIPEDQSQYLHQREAHRWNIEDQYAGANKKVVTAPEGGQPFRVEVECWGARVTDEGGESFSLGRFDQSHPPAEWDGRALTGRGEAFSLVYHIRPWRGPEGGWQNVDTDWSMDAPHDFRQVVGIDQCISHTPGDDAGARFACALLDYPSQTANIWEWDGNPDDIDGFRIYENRSATGETWVPIMDLGKRERMWFQLPHTRVCGETRRYKVAAFVTDGNRTSPTSSEIIRFGGECRNYLVTVTLAFLSTEKLDDGCTLISPFYCRPDGTMETYGSVAFWTTDETTGEVTYKQSLSIGIEGRLYDRSTLYGTGSGSPENLDPVKIHSEDWIEVEDLPMCHVGMDEYQYFCEDRNEGGHNRMALISKQGDRLHGKVSLLDYDQMSGDDLWCDLDFDIPTPDDLDLTQRREYEYWEEGSKGYGNCEVWVMVRWAAASGSRQTRPGENPLPPIRPTEADLEITEVSRNPYGNLRLTLTNRGPDTLVTEPVTIRVELERTPTDEVPNPNTDSSTERFVVTVPAHGHTILDTGLALDQEFEKRVTATVSTSVNLTDPNEDNNTRCFWFSPGDSRFPIPYRHTCR